MRSIIDIIHDYMFVPKCAGCGARMHELTTGICNKCNERYLLEKEESCELCGLRVSNCACIPRNLRARGCIDYRKLIYYKKVASAAPIRSMLYRVKKNYNVAMIRFFAKELFLIDNGKIYKDVVVTFAPRTHQAVKKYGYDHGKLLAEEYAKLGEYEFSSVFTRQTYRGQHEQKELNFEQRKQNVKDAFVLKDKDSVAGKHVILIDDIVTSGATMGECVATLFSAKAKSVSCRSIAQTYRNIK